MLPPDVREQMTPKRRGGIGAAAAENAASARARDVAMGDVPEEPKEKPQEKKEDAPDLKVCPRRSCKQELDSDWSFCARCGTDLLRGGPGKRLGVEFTEEDVQDYLFKGYVVREIKVLGKHVVTLKSSQPKDLEEIDNYLMNGDWTKDAEGNQRAISDFYLQQVNSLAVTAAAVQKIDGKPIGNTVVERLEWLKERGSAFVDLLSQRAVWFNQALTEYLKNEDNILGL